MSPKVISPNVIPTNSINQSYAHRKEATSVLVDFLIVHIQMVPEHHQDAEARLVLRFGLGNFLFDRCLYCKLRFWRATE